MEDVPFGKFGFIKHQTIDWVRGHASTLIGSVVVILIGLVSLSRWVKGDAQVDYLAAEAAYRNWEGTKGETLLKLQKILKSHPELHAKYDGAIAQKLLSSSENGLAKIYAKATLKRLGHFSPYYTEYSNGTLLIADRQLTEALAQAKQLKISMENDDAFWDRASHVARHGSILYGYNLVRIAMLEKAAGTPEGELLAWKTLKENAGWRGAQPASKTYDPEAYRLIQENFQNQDVSLLDYIEHREQLLR